MEQARTSTHEQTLKELFVPEGIQFTHDDGWQKLDEHIEVHKYFLGQQLGTHIDWNEALYSWYENVLQPLKQELTRWEFQSAFPQRSVGDLYLAVSEHWHFLKERNPETGAAEATESFLKHYGAGLTAWFSRFLAPAGTEKPSTGNSDSLA